MSSRPKGTSKREWKAQQSGGKLDYKTGKISKPAPKPTYTRTSSGSSGSSSKISNRDLRNARLNAIRSGDRQSLRNIINIQNAQKKGHTSTVNTIINRENTQQQAKSDKFYSQPGGRSGGSENKLLKTLPTLKSGQRIAPPLPGGAQPRESIIKNVFDTLKAKYESGSQENKSKPLGQRVFEGVANTIDPTHYLRGSYSVGTKIANAAPGVYKNATTPYGNVGIPQALEYNQMLGTVADIGKNNTFGIGKYLGSATEAIAYDPLKALRTVTDVATGGLSPLIRTVLGKMGVNSDLPSMGGSKQINSIEQQNIDTRNNVIQAMKTNRNLTPKHKAQLIKYTNTLIDPNTTKDIYDFAGKDNAQIIGEAIGAFFDVWTAGGATTAMQAALEKGGIKGVIKFFATKEGLKFISKQSLAGAANFAGGGIGQDLQGKKSLMEILADIPGNAVTGAIMQPAFVAGTSIIGSKLKGTMFDKPVDTSAAGLSVKDVSAEELVNVSTKREATLALKKRGINASDDMVNAVIKIKTPEDARDFMKFAKGSVKKSPLIEDRAITKTKADIVEAKRLMKTAPKEVSAEEGYLKGTKSKADYQKYIDDNQKWLDSKSQSLQEGGKTGLFSKPEDIASNRKYILTEDNATRNINELAKDGVPLNKDGTITLYRGQDKKFGSDESFRELSSWTTNPKLAKKISGNVYEIKVDPKDVVFTSKMGDGITFQNLTNLVKSEGNKYVVEPSQLSQPPQEGGASGKDLASNRTLGTQGQQESQILKTKEGRVSSQTPREFQKQPINTQQGVQGKVPETNKKLDTSYTKPIPPKPETVNKVFENAVVEKPKLGKSIVQATRDIFDPVAGVKEGTQIKTAFREHTATYRYQSDRAAQNSSTRSAVWDKVDAKDHLNFIHSVETGKPTPGSEGLYGDYRARFESDYKIMQEINPDAPYRKDYFTHNGLWADPKQATEFYNKWAKETLGGSKGFMKARTFPTVFDGLNAGLKLRETNPEKLFLNNHINVLKAKMADDFTKEMATAGMPESAVQAVVDRYMEKGIKGNAIYKTMREANAAMNSFQLGLSAFHFSTTTMNSAVSKLGLGMKEITQGRVFKGLGHIAETPISVFTDMIKGSKVMKQAFGDNPELYAGVKQVLEAGGTFRQSKVYRIGAWDKMMENFRMGGIKGIIKGTAQAPFAAVQKLSAPLMEWYVPRLKLGSFLSNASSELSRIGPNASKTEVRAILASAWDSTDNRFGQLVQDNLLWKQTVKDTLNISTRSLGWNLGTIRELGGAVTDIFRSSTWKGLAKGKGITDRQSYAVALPVVTAAIATMYMKMHGDKPSEMLDYFYPKTGDKTKQGYAERVSIPGYMKDVFAYKSNPGQTILNKQSPLLTVANKLVELSTTGGIKDYYGNWAVDPYATQREKTKQFAQFVADQFTPFSFSGAKQRMDKSLGAKIESGLGFQPAPAHITKGEDVTQLSQLWRDISPAPPKTPADVAAFDAKMQTLGSKEAPSPEKVKAQVDFLTKLRGTTDGTPERTQLIKDYYKTLSQDEITSVNYKLMLAGVSTKGVSTSKDMIDIQDRFDQVKKLDSEGNFAESDKIINELDKEGKYDAYEKADKAWKTGNSSDLGKMVEAKDTDGMLKTLMSVDVEEQDRLIKNMDAKINKDETITDDQVNAFDEAVKKMDDITSDPEKLKAYQAEQNKVPEAEQSQPGFLEGIKNKVNQYKDKIFSKTETGANDFFAAGDKVVKDVDWDLYNRNEEYRNLVDSGTARTQELMGQRSGEFKQLASTMNENTNMARELAGQPAVQTASVNIGKGAGVANNNPGNIKFVGQEGAKMGSGGFAKFDTPEAGYQALINDIDYKKSGKSPNPIPDGPNAGQTLSPESTLEDMIRIYAPTKDRNNPVAYANTVASNLGISSNTKLKDINKEDLAPQIALHESATTIGEKIASAPPKLNTTEESVVKAVASGKTTVAEAKTQITTAFKEKVSNDPATTTTVEKLALVPPIVPYSNIGYIPPEKMYDTFSIYGLIASLKLLQQQPSYFTSPDLTQLI